MSEVPTKTCRLVTLGCRVNQYETQLVKETLERNGYREASDGEAADLCVVNTCTVTNNGDSRSRQVIRQLAKHNPGGQTLVMGCYATRDPEAVRKLPNVFAVVTDKRELPDILARHGLYDMPAGISQFPGRKRAFVKVQDGCILRCSYCIIPSVRPGLQTRSPYEIEAEVRRLLTHGHQEIVLTGIHIGHYGVETTRGRSGLAPFRLWHLFRQLDRIPGDWRMRLSSIEAAEITEEFIHYSRDCAHLCPHFHPALQSGSETVLRRMRRRDTARRFLGTLDRLREKLDRPTFSTDVIVGFPGETDTEFEETLDFCRQAGFVKIHAFPFSPRRGTPAATLPDQVPGSVREERMRRLEQLDSELAQRYYVTQVGQRLEVIVEGPSPTRAEMVTGTDRRYVPVELPGSATDYGQLVHAIGVNATADCIVARRGDRNDVVRTLPLNISHAGNDRADASARITRPRLSEDDNLEEMGQDLQSLIDHHQCRQLVLNLETVQYITSAVLGKLITLHRRMHRKDGRLILCHASGSVADVLHTSQLINYFTVAPDAQQALAMFV